MTAASLWDRGRGRGRERKIYLGCREVLFRRGAEAGPQQIISEPPQALLFQHDRQGEAVRCLFLQDDLQGADASLKQINLYRHLPDTEAVGNGDWRAHSLKSRGMTVPVVDISAAC